MKQRRGSEQSPCSKLNPFTEFVFNERRVRLMRMNIAALFIRVNELKNTFLREA